MWLKPENELLSTGIIFILFVYCDTFKKCVVMLILGYLFYSMYLLGYSDKDSYCEGGASPQGVFMCRTGRTGGRRSWELRECRRDLRVSC